MNEATNVICLAASTTTVIGLYTRTIEELRDRASICVELPVALTSLSTRLPILTLTLQTIACQIEANPPPDNITIALDALIHRIAGQLLFLKASLIETIPFVNTTQIQRTVLALQSLTQDRNIQAAVERLLEDISLVVSYRSNQHADASDRILEALATLQLV